MKPYTSPKLRAANLIILAVALITAILFFHPHVTTFLITNRYPRCGHIVLVSGRRHGSTWFISNAEGCKSINGSYGDLNKFVEIWAHGKVRDISLEEAIDLVLYKSSVKIFPKALRDLPENVRGFFEGVFERNEQIPVFVLRRLPEHSFASLGAAKKSKVWNADHGGDALRTELEERKGLEKFKREYQTYFDEVKALMREVGIAWDEVHYEDILSQRVILGRNSKCYVRNCNFE